MARFMRPVTLISTGNWTISGAATIVDALDEAVANDATDYIIATFGDTPCEVKLSAVSDPLSSTGHIARFRIKSGGGSAHRVDANLYQGTTLIEHLGVIAFTGSWATNETTINAVNVDKITDYTDLRMRFILNNFSTFDIGWVTWCELEVPHRAPWPQAAMVIMIE